MRWWRPADDSLTVNERAEFQITYLREPDLREVSFAEAIVQIQDETRFNTISNQACPHLTFAHEADRRGRSRLGQHTQPCRSRCFPFRRTMEQWRKSTNHDAADMSFLRISSGGAGWPPESELSHLDVLGIRR